jgi:hypothetical protein
MRREMLLLVLVCVIGCSAMSRESLSTQPNEYLVSVPGMH